MWWNKLLPQQQRQATLLPLVMIKRGKWVLIGERVGIVSDLSSSDYVGVDFVDVAGNTLVTERVSPGLVTIAPLAAIPATRRPTAAVGASLGYY